MNARRDDVASTPLHLHLVGDNPGGHATLPTTLTRLLGREADLDAVCDLLRDPAVRVVTLTGPGGVGKTSLSIRIADQIAEEFADGAWFVPLAAVSDAADVPALIANTVAVRESGRRTVEEDLLAFLRGREALLVLDNFEHVLDAAEFVARIVVTAPRIKCLVSSRALLRISAEHDLPVTPLGLPESSEQDLTRVEAAPAVRLFVERARATNRAFTLTEANAEHVVAICRAVDGLPLAIELAASRVRHFSPSALRSRLLNDGIRTSLDLLVGGPVDAPSRQRSLRETIAWSVDLLTPWERALFSATAVFSGGFTIDAIESIAPAVIEVPADEAPPLVIDGIASLIDKSLLEARSTDSDDTRYTLAETIRHFALEMAREHGAEERARAAHAAYFLHCAGEAAEDLFGPRQSLRLRQLQSEHANLRAALSWLDTHDPAQLVRMARSLIFFWWYQGHLAEGQAWLERALAAGDAGSPDDRAWVAVGAAMLALNVADVARMRPLVEEAERSAERAGDLAAAGMAGMLSSWLAHLEERPSAAAARAQAAADLLRASGNDHWLANGLGDLGLILAETGERERGIAYIVEALALDRRRGNLYFAAVRLSDLGLLSQQAGDDGRAAGHYAESAHLLADVGGAWYLMCPLAGLAAVCVERDPRRCARLLGAALALGERSGQPGWPYERERNARASEVARAAIGDAAFDAQMRIGRALTLSELLAEADAAAELAPPEVPSTPLTDTNLSPRELEVLALLVNGHSDKEIAQSLFISPRTASKHVANILGKLEVETRGQAAVLAVRQGLV